MSEQEQDQAPPDGAAYFQINFELLAQVLRLPAGTRIRGVYPALRERYLDCCDIVIVGPGLPSRIGHDQVLPQVKPTWRSHADGRVEFVGYELLEPIVTSAELVRKDQP